MAKRGRPRKDPKLNVVSGSFKSKQKQDNPDKNKGKLTLPASAPDRPDHLNESEVNIWNALVSHLHSIGSLQKCDEGSLSAYCTAYDTLIRAKETLAKHRKDHGSDFFQTDGRHGEMIRAHPALKVIEANTKILKTLAQEFGMTPAGRKGLGYNPAQPLLPGFEDTPGGKTKDPFAGLV